MCLAHWLFLSALLQEGHSKRALEDIVPLGADPENQSGEGAQNAQDAQNAKTEKAAQMAQMAQNYDGAILPFIIQNYYLMDDIVERFFKKQFHEHLGK